MKWLLIILGVLLVLFSINQLQQRNLSSSSDQAFDLKRDDVFQFQITQGDESVSLTFNGENWSIDGNDTLLVKENTINGFFNSVLQVKEHHSYLTMQKIGTNIMLAIRPVPI